MQQNRREFGSVAAGNVFNFIDGTVDMLPQQARKARDEARLKASQLEGFRARMGQPFEQEDRLDHLQRIRSRLEALLSGTEGEPGEIGRLVAGYEAIKDGAAPAPAWRPNLNCLRRSWRSRRYLLNRKPPLPVLRPKRQGPASSPRHGRKPACSLPSKPQRKRSRSRGGGRWREPSSSVCFEAADQPAPQHRPV